MRWTKNPDRPYLTTLIPSDFPEASEIDEASYVDPWGPEAFDAILQFRRAAGRVARFCDDVIGYAVTVQHESHVEILRLAVAPDYRRRRVGRTILEAIEAATSWRRRKLVATIRETNLNGQLFLRSRGFRAVKVRRGQYGEHDGYLFVKEIGKSSASPAPQPPSYPIP